MYILFSFFVLMITPSVFCWLWLRKNQFVFQKDILFFIVLALLYLYLNLSPFLCMGRLPEDLQRIYFYLGLGVSLIFEVPLILLYRKLRDSLGKNTSFSENTELTAKWRYYAYLLFVLILSGVFLFIAIKYDIFYRRVGHEELAARSLSLSYLELILYRTYIETGAFVSISLLYFLREAMKHLSSLRWAVLLTFIVHSLVYGVYAVFNSRFQTCIFLVINFAFYAFWIRQRSAFGGLLKKRELIAVPILLLVAISLTSNLRYSWDYENKIEIETFVRLVFPNYKMSSQVQEMRDTGGTPFLMRTNGIDLMARITPGALKEGFLWGEAWKTPLLLNIYAFTNPEKYREIKKEVKTNAKMEILRRYTSIKAPDYVSSVLTDVYGNFGLFGFLPVVLFYGVLMAGVYHAANSPHVKVFPFFCIYGFLFSLYCEKEFITMLMDLFKFCIPFCVFSLLFFSQSRWRKRGA